MAIFGDFFASICGSMADIQSAAAEIRRGKKERKKKNKNKRQDENIMVCLFHRPTIITGLQLVHWLCANELLRLVQ